MEKMQLKQVAHCSSKDTELKCRVRSESSGDDLPGTERSTHLQLQTSEIFSYSLCLCRGEIGRLLVGSKPNVLSFSAADFAVLETNSENVLWVAQSSQPGEIYSSGLGFPPTARASLRGGRGEETEEQASVPKEALGHTVLFWTLFYSSLCHADTLYTATSPPVTQKLVLIYFFPKTYSNKRATTPSGGLEHKAEEAILQILTRQETQNGNHVPFKGIFNSFLF